MVAILILDGLHIRQQFVCLRHVFDIWGPSQSSPVPREGSRLAGSTPFTCRLTSSAPAAQPQPRSHKGQDAPVLTAAGPGIGLERSSWERPESLPKLFALASLKPAHPALPAPSHRNRGKGSCPHFLSLLLLLADLGVFPCGPALCGMSSPLGGAVGTNSLFSGSYLPICRPQHSE